MQQARNTHVEALKNLKTIAISEELFSDLSRYGTAAGGYLL